MHNRILRNLLPSRGCQPFPVHADAHTRGYIRFAAELLGGLSPFETADDDALDLFAEPERTSEELKTVLMNLPLRLPRIAVVITTRCTLRCTHCAHLNSHYETRRDYPVSVIVDAVRRVLSVCDVDFIALLGGEPLLHPYLPEIICALRYEPRLGEVSVTTNGTLPASESLLRALTHPKTRVSVSNYGDIIAPDATALVSSLTERGIRVHVADGTLPWSDAGGVIPRMRDESVLRAMYARCLFASCPTLLDGKLYVCPRHANAVNLGLIDAHKGGGVDLFRDNTDTLKAQIIDEVYIRESVQTCDLCDFISPKGTQTFTTRAT